MSDLANTATKTEPNQHLRIVVIDDSQVMLKFLEKNFTEMQYTVKAFKEPKKALEYLETVVSTDQKPHIITTDWKMPEFCGNDVITWLRRHPVYHQTPILMITAEINEEDSKASLKLGADDFIKKPIELEILQKKITHLGARGIDPDVIELYFSETSDLIDGILGGNLQDSQYRASLKRNLHTIKGNSCSVKFNYLSTLVHEAEHLLKLAEEKNVWNHEPLQNYISQFLNYIISQVQILKSGKMMDVLPEDLVKSYKEIEEFLKSSEKSDDVTTITTQTLVAPAPLIQQQNLPYLKVPREDIQELQALFKKIIVEKNNLRQFTMRLAQEFEGEEFPTRLIQITDRITADSGKILDFFINLQMVDIGIVKSHSQAIINDLKEKLQKMVKFEVEVTQVSLHQNVADVLMRSLTHLLRNSMDHGIEAPEIRETQNKNKEGTIKLSITPEGNDNLKIIISDDGKGIDRNKLIEKAKEKLHLNEAKINDLLQADNKEVFGLIFIEGFSTKDSADQISGRGVGMDSVKAELEKLGGSIEVNSELGKGTTFSLLVPKVFKL